MALKTFLNLSPERQKEIFLVCLEEFAHNDYESASLTRIIKKLGLAKGSFYRYFENKKDLYIYLVEECRKINAEEIRQGYYQPGNSFFMGLENGILTLIRTEKEYPHYLQFSVKVASEHRYDIFGSLVNKWHRQRTEIMTEIIRYHQEQGNIRKDIATDKLVQCFISLLTGIREYFFRKYLTVGKTGKKQHPPDVSEAEIRAELEDFIKVMRWGAERS